jgi:hypothetical protein
LPMILRTAPSVVSEVTWFRDLGARGLPWVTGHYRIEPREGRVEQ